MAPMSSTGCCGCRSWEVGQTRATRTSARCLNPRFDQTRSSAVEATQLVPLPNQLARFRPNVGQPTLQFGARNRPEQRRSNSLRCRPGIGAPLRHCRKPKSHDTHHVRRPCLRLFSPSVRVCGGASGSCRRPGRRGEAAKSDETRLSMRGGVEAWGRHSGQPWTSETHNTPLGPPSHSSAGMPPMLMLPVPPMSSSPNMARLEGEVPMLAGAPLEACQDTTAVVPVANFTMLLLARVCGCSRWEPASPRITMRALLANSAPAPPHTSLAVPSRARHMTLRR